MQIKDLLSTSTLLAAVLLWSPIVVNARYELRKTKLKDRQGKPRYKSSKSAIANDFDTDIVASRNLQDGEPCIALTTTVEYYHNGLTWQDPSFFTACASSLLIDTENMQLHIESLRKLFQQYHCFHDLAKDPSAGNTLSHQPELGNTIFTGEGSGQVNLEAGLKDIEQHFLFNGGVASMATFWEIRELFNRLFDAHVLLPRVEDNFYDYIVQVIPARFLELGDFLGDLFMDPKFSLDEDRKLQLTLAFISSNQTILDEKVVTSLNEKSVHEYIVDLANNPALKIPYQTIGARVNFLIQRGALFQVFSGSGTPTNILPDAFLATYEDGQEEIYLFGLLPSLVYSNWTSSQSTPAGESFTFVDRTLAEPFINQPGEQFDAFVRSFGSLDPSLNQITRSSRAFESEVKRAVSQKEQRSSFDFDKFVIADNAAYKIEDNYAILKLTSFQASPIEMIYMWNNVTIAAADAGVSKLIVDISDNLGGFIISGMTLILLMFPFLDDEWVSNQWEINYNEPMRLYLDVLLPVLDTIENNMLSLHTEVIEETIANFTETDFKAYEAAATGIVELCNDAVNSGDESFGATLQQCLQAYNLESNVTNFVVFPSLSTYQSLISSLSQTVQHYSPWSVVTEIFDPNVTMALVEAGPQTITRGGVESNVTAKFDILGSLKLDIKDLLDDFYSTGLLMENVFDEYVMVSSGVSGSMAAIFPFESAQLYKNKDQSQATSKVILCGYGGTGNADDLSLSSFPASVQSVHLEDPIIGDAALAMLIGMFPDNMPDEKHINAAAFAYSESVAIPPYFADTLPIMPVVNFYNKFMEPGAMPLQYVKIPLDEYIPNIFTSVSYEDSSDLAELYARTAVFFTFSNTTTVPVVEPTGSMPATGAPFSAGPITDIPTTSAPITLAPFTTAPATPPPVPSTLVIGAPVSPMSVTTTMPTTSAPVTSTPTTVAPVPTSGALDEKLILLSTVPVLAGLTFAIFSW